MQDRRKRVAGEGREQEYSAGVRHCITPTYKTEIWKCANGLGGDMRNHLTARINVAHDDAQNPPLEGCVGLRWSLAQYMQLLAVPHLYMCLPGLAGILEGQEALNGGGRVAVHHHALAAQQPDEGREQRPGCSG